MKWEDRKNERVENMTYQPVNESRHLWKYYVFGILTLGIYCIWFEWTMIEDLNTACGYVEDTQEYRSPHYLIRLLLTIVTFGIYTYFWYYKQGQRLRDAGRKYDLEIDDRGSTYLLWMLAGMLLFGIGPIIAFYIFICNCNKICRCYNLRSREDRNSGNSPSAAKESSGQADATDFFHPHRVVTVDPVFSRRRVLFRHRLFFSWNFHEWIDQAYKERADKMSGRNQTDTRKRKYGNTVKIS